MSYEKLLTVFRLLTRSLEAFAGEHTASELAAKHGATALTDGSLSETPGLLGQPQAGAAATGAHADLPEAPHLTSYQARENNTNHSLGAKARLG